MKSVTLALAALVIASSIPAKAACPPCPARAADRQVTDDAYGAGYESSQARARSMYPTLSQSREREALLADQAAREADRKARIAIAGVAAVKPDGSGCGCR